MMNSNMTTAEYTALEKAFKEMEGRAVGALELLRRGLDCGVFDDAPVFKADVLKLLAKVSP